MPELKLSDSASLHYEVYGEQGPWLVLVSGIGGHGAFWVEQVRHFSSFCRVVIHDHRGHGQSTGGGPDSGVAQASSDVLRLLDSLGADRVVLVGHSMGGLIVQQFALDHADRVQGLVIGGSGAAADDYTRLVLGFRQRVLEKLGQADFCRLQTLLTVGTAAHTVPIKEILASEERSLQGLPVNDVLLARLASIATFDRSSELAKLKMPVLVVSSEDDVQATPEAGRQLAGLIPRAQLTVFPAGGGHFFPRTNPAPYNTLLERFTRELTS
ncbi:alpha/beta fold hydrolase [Pseudomonas japonica]|uniref:alpha/beta fold hydrolase n=1 Tax=Pseudomonas japonica TaxID=256466 RepID=UPI0037F5A956